MAIGFDVDGPIGARPIVLLHAASYTRKMWLPQMRALSSEYRVVAIDLLGHGERSDERFDFDRAVGEVEAVVESLGIGPAVFVGASLGGCVALTLADRSRKRVAGLILAGSSFDARTLPCRLVLTGESIVFPRIERRLIGNFQRYLRKKMPVSDAESIAVAGSYWRAAADAVAQMRGRDFVGMLRAYDGPVAIVNGERDWPHRFYEGRFLRAARHGSLAIIEGANHICSLDAPDRFTEIARTFANRCPFPVSTAVRE